MKQSSKREKFSEEWLKTVKACAEAHVHYYDSDCPALALRVTRAGHKAFKAFVRGDSPKFFPIAEVGTITLDEARTRALDILQRLDETGLSPQEFEEAEKERREKKKRLRITLRAVLEEYATVRTLPGKKVCIKQSTADMMRREVPKYLAPLLDKPLRSLTYKVLQGMHKAISDRPAPVVADRMMRNVSAFINYIEETEEVRLFDHNPARKLLRLDGHAEVVRKTVLPAKRFPDFFAAVAAMERDARDFLLISLFTGLRAGSIKTLRWDLIDLDERVVTLTMAKGKQDKTVTLPLSGYVTTLLRRREALTRGQPYVFPHPKAAGEALKYHDSYLDWLWAAGGGVLAKESYPLHDGDGQPRFGKRGKPLMGRRTVLSGISRVCNQAGGPLIHHDLRRTFCSVAATAAGVDVFAAMRLSLHEFGGGATKCHSDYVVLDHLRSALESITEAILKLGQGPDQQAGPGAGNVVRLFPGRPASPPQSQQPSASPLTAA